MKITLKRIEDILSNLKISITQDENGEFFIALHKTEIGSIYPKMIKMFDGETLHEVEEDINPDTYIYKDFIDEESGLYYEIKIRAWMIDSIHK